MTLFPFARQMNDIRLMLTGLKANRDRLAKRGVTPEYLQDFTELYEQVMRVDSEQEALKARLKEKTRELQDGVAVLSARYRQAKKIVKLEIPQEGWLEFGIEDKK